MTVIVLNESTHPYKRKIHITQLKYGVFIIIVVVATNIE